MPEQNEADFRAESLFPIDPEIASESLKRALLKFKEMSSDVAAKLITQPLSDGESAELMDSMGQVSAYIPTDLRDFLDETSETMCSNLARQLSSCELSNVDYQGVWTLGKIVVLYVRGEIEAEAS